MMFVAVLACVMSVGVGSHEQDVAGEKEPQPYRYIRQSSGPMLSLEVAGPILPYRFRALSERLALSEDQADYVTRLYQRYLRDDRTFRERELTPLMAIAESLGSLHEPQDRALHEKLRRDAGNVRQGVAAIEERLFASIAEVLTDEQARVEVQQPRKGRGSLTAMT